MNVQSRLDCGSSPKLPRLSYAEVSANVPANAYRKFESHFLRRYYGAMRFAVCIDMDQFHAARDGTRAVFSTGALLVRSGRGSAAVRLCRPVAAPGEHGGHEGRAGRGEHHLFAFLTCEPNAVVAPIHPKAMPVLLTTPAECETWMTAPAEDALRLQRRLADSLLSVVARGEKQDPPAVAPEMAPALLL